MSVPNPYNVPRRTLSQSIAAHAMQMVRYAIEPGSCDTPGFWYDPETRQEWRDRDVEDQCHRLISHLADAAKRWADAEDTPEDSEDATSQETSNDNVVQG